jgi:hypothetical protein
MTEIMSEDKKIIIDEDWKSQVEREREELEKQPDESDNAQPRPGEIPPASFPMLVTSIGTQAMMALGQVPDPMSGKAIYHPELARHHIDTLAILEEKTQGNLSDEEKEMLTNFTSQLRELFVAMQSANLTMPAQPGEGP